MKGNKIVYDDDIDFVNKQKFSFTMELPKSLKQKVDKKDDKNRIDFRNSTGREPKLSIFTDEEWKQKLENNSIKYENKEKLIYSLKLGINNKLRGKIWMLLYKTISVAMNHNENLFYKLVNTKDDALDDLINKDIKRTILYTHKPETNEVFKIDISSKHSKLFNILKAYAVYDSEVSYVQGMNYVVAVLLSNINSERACFWTFVQIMNDKKWRDIYTHNTPKLIRMLGIVSDSIQAKIPDLYKYFENISFVEFFAAVFTQYFVTLFSYNCPIEYANRVIDLFWVYEEKIILDCLIHLLDLQKEFLMKLELDDLFPYLRDKIIISAINLNGMQKSLPFS